MLTELVSKMRDMQMDKTELGCLRAIVLFNPGTALATTAMPCPRRPGAVALVWGGKLGPKSTKAEASKLTGCPGIPVTRERPLQCTRPQTGCTRRPQP